MYDYNPTSIYYFWFLNYMFLSSIIGCSDKANGKMLKKLFQTPYFRIVVVDDVQTVEMCGALKVYLLIPTLTYLSMCAIYTHVSISLSI